MHTGNTQGDSYFRLNINIENNPLCSCDNGRAGFPYAVSYAVPGCPHKHQSTGWSSLRRNMGICFARSHPVDWCVLSSFGVFCHHSCREAVLRGLTSASRQANAQIAMFSCHEADLGGLTSASRQIPISVPRQVLISASRQIFIRHSTISFSCAFCNKRLDHEVSMQA